MTIPTVDPLTWPKFPALDAFAGTAICPGCGLRGPFVSGACGMWLRCKGCGAETHMVGDRPLVRVMREATLRLMRTVRGREVQDRMTPAVVADYYDRIQTARDAARAAHQEVCAFYAVERNCCDRCGLAGTLTRTPAGELCIYCYEGAIEQAEWAAVLAEFPDVTEAGCTTP